jgi:hypothetical protein
VKFIRRLTKIFEVRNHGMITEIQVFGYLLQSGIAEFGGQRAGELVGVVPQIEPWLPKGSDLPALL